jgi:hypothetical protein
MLYQQLLVQTAYVPSSCNLETTIARLLMPQALTPYLLPLHVHQCSLVPGQVVGQQAVLVEALNLSLIKLCSVA